MLQRGFLSTSNKNQIRNMLWKMRDVSERIFVNLELELNHNKLKYRLYDIAPASSLCVFKYGVFQFLSAFKAKHAHDHTNRLKHHVRPYPSYALWDYAFKQSLLLFEANHSNEHKQKRRQLKKRQHEHAPQN